MWLKIGNEYCQNPVIIGTDFLIRTDDLDGSRIIVKAQKTSRRKMLASLKKHCIPAKIVGEPRDCGDILRMHLINGIECSLQWKFEPFVLGSGVELQYDYIVKDRPAFGVVINEKEKGKK